MIHLKAWKLHNVNESEGEDEDQDQDENEAVLPPCLGKTPSENNRKKPNRTGQERTENRDN